MRWSVFEWKVLSVYTWLVWSAPHETIDRDFDPGLAIVGHARVQDTDYRGFLRLGKDRVLQYSSSEVVRSNKLVRLGSVDRSRISTHPFPPVPTPSLCLRSTGLRCQQ